MVDSDNSIDTTISSLNSYIEQNQKKGSSIFRLIQMVTLAFLIIVLAAYMVPLAITEKPRMPENVLFGLFAVYIVVFGVLIALYRHHLNEISKTEHYKMGFLRVRIAANNYKLDGFKTEVRESLVNEAFSHHLDKGSFLNKKVNSPLPGHPTSDFSVVLINRLLDAIESKAKNEHNKPL